MLTGDLDRLLAAEISALQPPPAITTAGTWEAAPPGNAPGVPYVPGVAPLSGGAGCQVPAVVAAGGGRAAISAASSRSRSPVSTVAG